jgi:hypothetical protein
MNKVIQIVSADRCELEYQGIRYIFLKNKPVEVPFTLADRLLRGGEFVDIVPTTNPPADAVAPANISPLEKPELPPKLKEALEKQKDKRAKKHELDDRTRQ